MIVLGIVGVCIGAISGFFGVGGGMILTPILLLLGFDIKTAIGISIIQMVFSSVFGSYLNAKKGTLIIGEGIFVGLGGFLGGFLGGYITHYISDMLLQYIFLGLLLFALFRLLSAPLVEDTQRTKQINKIVLFFLGTIIGVFSITLGIGGAIILTPILVGLLHYPLKKAISASLFFVVFSSIAGLISRLANGTIDFEHGLVVAISSLFGVALGIWLKEYISSTYHKRTLLLLYVLVIFVLIKKMWF